MMLRQIRNTRRQFIIVGAITGCLILCYACLIDVVGLLGLRGGDGLSGGGWTAMSWAMMWNCAFADPPPLAVLTTLDANRSQLSQTEPLGLRTVADGNYLPRVPPSFQGANCTPIMQRGHVVIYTPQQVRAMLAGGGPIKGSMPRFVPTKSPKGPTDERDCPLSRPGPLSSAGMHAGRPQIELEKTAALDEAEFATGAPGQTRYSPVVIFADLGYDDDERNWVENVPLEWILHTVFTPRATKSFIAAIFFHRQNVTNAFDLEAAREYIQIPGVTRALYSYLFPARPNEDCSNLGRLARFVQPHMVIAAADEQARRACPTAVVAQQCYGADRARCGATKCARPLAIAEFHSHGADGAVHVPTWTWPLAEPRPMRRADTPPPPEGWNAYEGWPLPFGRLLFKPGTPWSRAAIAGHICQRYELKRPPPPPPGTYTNENLRPLDCYNASLRSCLLGPPSTPLFIPVNDTNLTQLPPCPAPPAPEHMAKYYAFPPRYAYPLQVPPLERPRRLVWSLIGSMKYGGRAVASAAFEAEFSGLPAISGSAQMERAETLTRIMCDSVFVVIGAGNAAFETARPFEGARCGAIPVLATVDPPYYRPSLVRDAASAYTTLIGFEGQWPDGWIVASTWQQAAALARRALETPGEVLRLRRVVMNSYKRMQHAMNVRTRLAIRRAADPDYFWNSETAMDAVAEQQRVDEQSMEN